MNANLVEPTARENMAGTKRFWNRVNPTYPTTQSTADSYVITPSVPVTGYGLYERWATRFNIANASTSPTVLVSSLPALNIKKYVAGALTAPASGDIQGGVAQTWYYDGLGNAILENPVPVVTQNFTSIASTSNGGINYSAATGAIVTRVDPSLFTTKSSFTSSDSVLTQAAGSTFVTTGLISALKTTLGLPALKSPSIFTTSGSFVASFTGVHKITVIGGGGGGGGATNVGSFAAGGGAGATVYSWQSLTSGNTYAVQIGIGGAGGSSGGGDGAAGVASVFAGATTVTAGGGGLGGGSTGGGGVDGIPGAGGTTTNGDLQIPGGPGFPGPGVNAGTARTGGQGGSSSLGGGGVGGIAVTGTGGTATVPGGGGGGASTGTGAAGGAGAKGVVLVEWTA